MKRIFYFLISLAIMACTDDDTFSTSSGLTLDFSVDTLKMDTVFCNTPSSTYSFWVYNHHDDGLRLQTIRLKRGNQTGYRVNVDGTYLDNSNGSQVHDIEIRRKDSILVFVELTPSETYQSLPVELEDDLLFSLESGVEQKVCLHAYAWDALKWYSPVIAKDSLIELDKPLVVYGDMVVNEGARLSIKNTTIYFHDDAGLSVYGDLETDNCVFRGDRLDKMFSYLPYDRISGQWKGLHFYETSKNNSLNNTNIRNSVNGIVCDSSAIDSTQYRLWMGQCIVHNCEGYGVQTTNSKVHIENCQISNTLGDCLNINGGMAEVIYCTLAQFYPFSADRGAALRFSNGNPLLSLEGEGLIITGYADDVLMGDMSDSSNAFDYHFSNSLIRTPSIDDTAHFNDIIWESANDSIQGKAHFILIDEDNLKYDFHLDSKSPAVGLGCYR